MDIYNAFVRELLNFLNYLGRPRKISKLKPTSGRNRKTWPLESVNPIQQKYPVRWHRSRATTSEIPVNKESVMHSNVNGFFLGVFRGQVRH